MSSLIVLSIPLLLIASGVSGAGFDFDLRSPRNQRPDSFDFNRVGPPAVSPLFLSDVRSTKSDHKQSRTEETLNEVLTHSASSQWTRGFQDNGQGGLQKLDSSSSQEQTAGSSAKELKASESGESSQRDQQLSLVNGKTVLNSDAGKQSSFNNSGHSAKNTEFSSESSTSDNRLVKMVLPPPPPPLAACFGKIRASLIFLVHTSADAETFARVLGFLEAFLGRLVPVRAVVLFFNSHVLDFIEYPIEAFEGRFRSGGDGGDSGGVEALQRSLAAAARKLRGSLGDECNLQAATAAAAALRKRLRIPAPCSLLLLAPGAFRADERALEEARIAASEASRSFDHLMAIFDRGDGRHSLGPQATGMLRAFSGGPSGFLPLEFGAGGLADAQSADMLGQRICDAAETNAGRFEEPGPPPRGLGWPGR